MVNVQPEIRVPGRQKGCEIDTGINIYTKKREVERRWPICSMREELTRSRLSFRSLEKKNSVVFSTRSKHNHQLRGIKRISSVEFASLLFPSISISPPARVFEVNHSPKISASTGKSPAASAG